MKIYKETEKAVNVRLVYERIDGERRRKEWAWIPKSQIRNGEPSMWIVSKKTEELIENYGNWFYVGVEKEEEAQNVT